MNITYNNLWGEDIEISSPQTQDILKKIKKPKAPISDEKLLKSDKVNIHEKLQIIQNNVSKILGKYESNTVVLKTKEQLSSYIQKALENKVIAIDTETNHSLDPLTCILMGGCIYTPGEKNAYIPINHVDPETKERLKDQLTEKDLFEEFSKLKGINIITHNGKFDYQVLKCTVGWEMPITWDTMIGAKLLDTTERAGLKQQYIDKIDSSVEKYDIETFFSDIPYEYVAPELFALYAATDAYMTYKLYLYQLKEFEKPENKGLMNIMRTVEVPVIIPVAEMELNGVSIDREYASRLSIKYHKKLEEVDSKISEELDNISQKIKDWRLTTDANVKPNKKTGDGLGKSKNEQLSDPPNLASPTQLAILIYDVFKIKPLDKKAPRGTGEDILAKIDLPICKLITERRGLIKLINTYIDKIPQCTNPKDGKVHTHFNQYGTETGRFSSSDPINLQNIPSHEKSIRLIFQASPGYVMLGSDFSSQEPRLLATYAQDKNMIQAFIDNKDLYAIIAEKVYNNSYEDNLQTHLDGSPFPEGKERRSNCKNILLGLMYGRGPASIAEQIGKSTEEAQTILDKFYRDFPAVKMWIDKTQSDAHTYGYVEDLWGRRRNLPNIKLPPYTVKTKETTNIFNPLIGSLGLAAAEQNTRVKYYADWYSNTKSKEEKEKLKERASLEGIIIQNNQGFIAEAERQSINARIQGGAASMSKKAMIAIYNDPEMRRLGFKLLIMVHDELIGECPIENQSAAMGRLSYLMSEAGKPEVDLPMKCDVVAFSHWYLDEYTDMICEEFNKLHTKEADINKIIHQLQEKHCESTLDDIKEMLKCSGFIE